jgi:predicted O-methyltransferase YrrM
MSSKPTVLTDDLHDYLLDVSLREAEVLRRLRADTARMKEAEMQIAPEQGQFMALLARAIGAGRVLEIGVFTGYSSLAVAMALPGDGKIVACDVNEEYTSVARKYWREAGVEDKIDLRLGPALDTLEALAGENVPSFDMAFIDADKENIGGYYEHCLALVRHGGLILIDNALRGGNVLKDEADQDGGTRAVAALNERLRNDNRVDISLLSIADGLFIARKR